MGYPMNFAFAAAAAAQGFAAVRSIPDTSKNSGGGGAAPAAMAAVRAAMARAGPGRRACADTPRCPLTRNERSIRYRSGQGWRGFQMSNVTAFKSFSRRGSHMIVNAPNTRILTAPPNRSPNAPIIGYHNVVVIGKLSRHPHQTLRGRRLRTLRTRQRISNGNAPSTAEQYLTVSDLDGDIDYVGIAAHNLGSSGSDPLLDQEL